MPECLVPESLPDLERERAKLLEQFLSLGDFRPGSITASVRRCGKPSCHCAKPNDPGHQPQFRMSRKVKGKTVNESFASPGALRKAQREVAEFQRLARARPTIGGHQSKNLCASSGRGGREQLDPRGKKKAAAVHQEITREINLLLSRIFAERHKTGSMDLEAVELALRASLHQAGATALTALLQFDPPSASERQLPCPCGDSAKYVGLRFKSVLTALGEAQCSRPYYLCERCHHGQFPVDLELDIQDTELSPGVRRMMAAVGHEAAFDRGREQLKLLAGLSVTTKTVERTAEAIGADIERRQQPERKQALQLELPIPLVPRIPILYVEMDGTGVPVVRKESAGRAGKQDGQPAHTREAKLGCVFTQTTVDDEGYPVRDEASTTYVGAIESCEEFGRRLYTEAWRRGWARAEKRVVLGDGAEWIWNQADLHFLGAIQIVDLYHARQHLWDLSAKLYPGNSPAQRRW